MHFRTPRRRLRATTLALALAALPMALPTPAVATSVGTGVATGFVYFAGSGLPPVVGPGTPPTVAACAYTSFWIDGWATGAALHTVLSGFAGNIFLGGRGSSTICETAAVGTGNITLTADGTAPTGSKLSCPELQGKYQRVGLEVVLNLTGPCSVNYFPAGTLRFAAHAELTSVEGGTTPVTSATFVAEFSIVPV